MSDKRRTSSSKKNTFILKKLENENKLQDEIKMSFDDPTKYLSVNPNMIIGKIILFLIDPTFYKVTNIIKNIFVNAF